MEQRNKPDEIVRAGGREFPLFKYRDEFDGKFLLDLPDFDKNPEFTDEGRPFTLHVQDSCPHARSRDPDDPDDPDDPGDCGGCVWFHRDEPYAPIGVCMCDEMKREKEEERPK